MKKWIVAHRGSRLKAPENTLEAFERAVLDGADWIELDVRRAQDATLLIHHDADFEGEKIAERSFSFLRELSQKRGKPIPSLEETLDFCRGKINLDIELKESGYEEEFLRILKNHGSPSEVVITSFLPQTLQRIKEMAPKWKTGLLLGSQGSANPIRNLFLRLGELFPYGKISKTRVDFLVPHLSLVRAGFLIWNRRLPVLVWTVNRAKTIQRLLRKERVLGVISDDPEMACRAANLCKKKRFVL